MPAGDAVESKTTSRSRPKKLRGEREAVELKKDATR